MILLPTDPPMSLNEAMDVLVLDTLFESFDEDVQADILDAMSENESVRLLREGGTPDDPITVGDLKGLDLLIAIHFTIPPFLEYVAARIDTAEEDFGLVVEKEPRMNFFELGCKVWLGEKILEMVADENTPGMTKLDIILHPLLMPYVHNRLGGESNMDVERSLATG